jgi:hypothetical protein
MPIRCLTAGRMTMTAALLHRNTVTATPDLGDLSDYGDWVDSQDPLTGQIVKVWKPFPDIPETPEVDESLVYSNFPCVARGIVDGGIRVAGTTERFGDTYENIDFVKMWVPAGVKISKRDRVTNIRDPRGRIIWKDEEFSDPTDPDSIARASVFNVNGVTPLFNAFNRHTESFVLLENVTVAQDAAL